MRNVETMECPELLEYERALSQLYEAVGKLARIGLPLARMLWLAQVAYDKAHRAAVNGS